MTIGSSYDYPAERAAELHARGELTTASDWGGRYPNPPDLNFNYRKLVEGSPIATAASPDMKIAIVGAGITGLTAARELLRCGFRNLSVFEADSRVGGRHYTVTNVANQGLETTYSPFEMAAMRMPFFNASTEAPAQGWSLLANYANEFALSFENFPNPSTKYVESTGIYLNEGLLSSKEPQLIVWKNPSGVAPPPDLKLAAVYAIWQAFHLQMVNAASQRYGTGDWAAFWNKVVNRYKDISFRQFVKLPVKKHSGDGDFGGLGLTQEQSDIFYSIGFGDGSWGAFYDVCALYPLRTAVFGFSSNLQLIHGRFDLNGKYNPGPYSDVQRIKDSAGNLFEAPRYLGVKSFDDCMLFLPPSGMTASLYDSLRSSNTGLLTSTRVTAIQYAGGGKTNLTYVGPDQKPVTQTYDAVIVTLPSWLIEMNIEVGGYDDTTLPYGIVRSWETAHWETSCKIYAPLKPEFFTDANNNIPQILVTDSYSHDMYAYKYGVGGYKYPAILISYTWEDDATKLASFPDKALVAKCVSELDRILLRCQNVNQPISPYIDQGNAMVMRWITQPSSLGCAKLYRPGTYGDAVSLLAYNRTYSAQSGLYLAGESFSVDAGWTEPSFRGAVDAVVNICSNTGATFNKGFTMNDYPSYTVPA